MCLEKEIGVVVTKVIDMLRIKSNKLPIETSQLMRRLASKGLSRIVNHMLNRPFGMISGYSSRRTAAENKIKHNELKILLHHEGIGYNNTQGIWQETGADGYLPEPSLFIINVSQELTRSLAQKFDQEAYVWGKDGYYWVQNTDTGQLYDKDTHGVVQDHFVQHQEVPEETPLTKVKGRIFALDPEQPKRVRLLQEKLERGEDLSQPPSREHLSDEGRVAEYKKYRAEVKAEYAKKWPKLQGYYFYSYGTRLPCTPQCGILCEEDGKLTHRNGAAFESFIPLKLMVDA